MEISTLLSILGVLIVPAFAYLPMNGRS